MLSLLKSRKAWFFAKALLVAVAVPAALLIRWHVTPSGIAPVDPEVSALIDQLVFVTEQGPGTHPTAWASGFIAVGEEMKFRGGIFGSERPVVHPAMRELVRMGVRALPDLLNHLSDDRKTGLSVRQHRFRDGQGSLGFMGIWHGDEYDPRFEPPEKQPDGVNKGERGFVEEYTLRVGDLSYVAIGQIVNRHLSAFRYQPTLCLVINSPVETPALADAVRKDWAGLTEEQHQQSLIDDALSDTSRYGAPAALQRLCFYYRKVGEPVAVKLLSRPWHDFLKVRNFVTGPLVEEQAPGRWKPLIAEFARQNGPAAAEAVPDCLGRLNWASFGGELKAATAKRILAEVYPDRPRFVNAATEDDQKYLIEGLSSVQSEKIDAAVAKVFRSIDLKRYDPLWVDDLAVACIDRLIGKGMEGEFKTYCENRIGELAARQLNPAETQRLELLQERLRRLVR